MDPENPSEITAAGENQPLDAGLLAQAGQLAAKHEAEAGAAGLAAPPKRGRGRPPIHGRYSAKGAPVAGAIPEPPVADEAEFAGDDLPGGDIPRVTIPPELASKVAKLAWDQLNGLARSDLKSRAAGLPAGLRDDVAGLVDSAGLSDEQVQLCSDLTPLALEEWGLDGMTSPTAALVAVASAGLLSWRMTAGKIDALAKEYSKRQPADNPASA